MELPLHTEPTALSPEIGHYPTMHFSHRRKTVVVIINNVNLLFNFKIDLIKLNVLNFIKYHFNSPLILL